MSQAGPHPDGQNMPAREGLRQRVEARIRRLERASLAGLWSMVLFLLVSFGAYDNFSFLPELTEDFRNVLGAPPPSEMISLALVIYAFSGIVGTLARMSRNIKPFRGLIHAAFFTAFYAFYFLSGVLPDNFWAVFFAGLSVMGLENYYLWSHSNEALKKEREILGNLRGEDH